MQVLCQRTKGFTLEEEVQCLVEEARQYPKGHLRRQQCLTQVIRLIEGSQKLWREDTPYYGDALQQTWLYFCQNICEATTGCQYDASRASVVTWLDRYLRWRLQDLRNQANLNAQRTKICMALVSDRPEDAVEELPARPDIPPILEETKNWVLADPWGVLSQICVQNRPDLTAQVLISKRLPPEMPWQKISLEYGISVSTLSSFYQRQCIPLLRRFAQTQGYL